MSDNREKAQILFKLTRKHNWGAKYDRLEHFKRFAHLDASVKDLANMGSGKRRPGWLGLESVGGASSPSGCEPSRERPHLGRGRDVYGVESVPWSSR